MKQVSLKQLPLVRLFVPRPRFAGAIAFGLGVYALMPLVWPVHQVSRMLLAYDLGALLYIGLAGAMMATSGTTTMRRRSLREDEGKIAMLAVVVVSSIAALMAIAVQLAVAKELHGLNKAGHVGLAASTVLISWTFTQVMFALHYAHEFYHHRSGEHGSGLDFPGTTAPTYFDFVYFSCVIGISGQTADVSISGSSMRRFALLHCVLAYIFNTTLLALTINVAASLI